MKQTNGIAIYHLSKEAADGSVRGDAGGGMGGGEYMVSASIDGPPGEVLELLMEGSSNTTILGPASKVEVLNSKKDKDGEMLRYC